MPDQIFNDLMPNDAVRQKIVQIEIMCKPLNGLRVEYTDVNVRQLRIWTHGASQDQVILTMQYQKNNKKFFFRSYAQPSALIRLGLDNDVVKTPKSKIEPLKSEFKLNEIEFLQYIFAIIEETAKSKSITIKFP